MVGIGWGQQWFAKVGRRAVLLVTSGKRMTAMTAAAGRQWRQLFSAILLF
jgi:hypothetical protein